MNTMEVGWMVRTLTINTMEVGWKVRTLILKQ